MIIDNNNNNSNNNNNNNYYLQAFQLIVFSAALSRAKELRVI